MRHPLAPSAFSSSENFHTWEVFAYVPPSSWCSTSEIMWPWMPSQAGSPSNPHRGHSTIPSLSSASLLYTRLKIPRQSRHIALTGHIKVGSPQGLFIQQAHLLNAFNGFVGSLEALYVLSELIYEHYSFCMSPHLAPPTNKFWSSHWLFVMHYCLTIWIKKRYLRRWDSSLAFFLNSIL